MAYTPTRLRCTAVVVKPSSLSTPSNPSARLQKAYRGHAQAVGLDCCSCALQAVQAWRVHEAPAHGSSRQARHIFSSCLPVLLLAVSPLHAQLSPTSALRPAQLSFLLLLQCNPVCAPARAQTLNKTPCSRLRHQFMLRAMLANAAKHERLLGGCTSTAPQCTSTAHHDLVYSLWPWLNVPARDHLAALLIHLRVTNPMGQ
jgi:hypothetical protein